MTPPHTRNSPPGATPEWAERKASVGRPLPARLPLRPERRPTTKKLEGQRGGAQALLRRWARLAVDLEHADAPGGGAGTPAQHRTDGPADERRLWPRKPLQPPGCPSGQPRAKHPPGQTSHAAEGLRAEGRDRAEGPPAPG